MYMASNANYPLSHYSYECKAAAQERPYVSRPSRTQQLLNPKLAPKLMSDIPQDLLRKCVIILLFHLASLISLVFWCSSPTIDLIFPASYTDSPIRKGVADEQLAKAELERGRKRERASEDPELRGASKRMRSASSASSASVSTISTNLSRSPSPRESTRNIDEGKRRSMSLSKSPSRRESRRNVARSHSLSKSPPPVQKLTDSEKKRRRASLSSGGSYTSGEGRDSRERDSSRSTRRRFQELSPPARGRRTESRSPHRRRRRLSNDRRSGRNGFHNGGPLSQENRPPRQRSLSPFSKRLALTQAMNMRR
jgi:hypothetical protein